MHEIVVVAGVVGEGRPGTTISFGGGTPTILDPDSFLALAARLRQRFDVRPGAEIAVEIDPRGLDRPRIDALGAAGVNRASLGVQDVHPVVQRAINRMQSLEMVAGAVAGLREAGGDGLNADHNGRASGRERGCPYG